MAQMRNADRIEQGAWPAAVRAGATPWMRREDDERFRVVSRRRAERRAGSHGCSVSHTFVALRRPAPDRRATVPKLQQPDRKIRFGSFECRLRVGSRGVDEDTRWHYERHRRDGLISVVFDGAAHTAGVVGNHATDGACVRTCGIRSEPSGPYRPSIALTRPRIIPGRARTRQPLSSTFAPNQWRRTSMRISPDCD
jgi:hypothetical protein